MEHHVEEGDIWRMCQVKDAPSSRLGKLAVKRAREQEILQFFGWIKTEPMMPKLIKKVNQYLKDHDTTGLDIRIMSPDRSDPVHC